MAITAAERREIAEIIVLMFDAAPGATYLAQLISAYQAVGNNLNTLTDLIAAHPAYASVHTVIDTDEEWTDDLLATVGLQGDFQAETTILNALNDGVSKGDITYGLYTFLNDVAADPSPWTNYASQYVNAAAILENKAEVAIYYSVTVANPSTNMDELMDAIENVDASQSSVDDAIDAINGDTGASVIKLAVGVDDLNGTAFADTFEARVVQNSLGEQVNQLGSGDQIDGGNGMDMLTAKITAGAFVGGSYSMPIEPETSSVEVIKLQAVESDIDGYNDEYGNTQVYVNAKDMVDVQQLWSNRSDADLMIQNLTTQGLTQLSDMTIGMAYTGNADSRWGESDYTVYFDQDYLTPEATSTSPVVDFLAMNEDNYDATDGARPLDGVFFRQLQFTVTQGANSFLFDLVPYLGEDKSVGATGSEITTYPEFLAAVQSALVQLKAATSTSNPVYDALQTVQANFGPVFTTDANPDTLELREGIAVRLSVDGLIDGVANNISVIASDLEVARAISAPESVPNNNRYELASNTPPESGEVLAINVALEKVGLAGDGGMLIIGSMNKDEDNEWDAVNTVTDTTSGIEQFNVTVYGNNDKSSSLSGLHSTNNNLRVVNVVTDADLTGTSFADLTIGNSNSWLWEVDSFSSYGPFFGEDGPNEDAASNEDGGYYYDGYEYALKDVQVFNASGFKGDLTLYAGLTEEVVAKYLDLQDDAPDAPAADNVAFVYTGGTGDDDFNVTLSAANLAAEGTTTREDFSLAIDGADGDDEITLAIIDSEGNGNGDYDDEDEQGLAYGDGGVNGSGFANWYDNNQINANLSIAGGDGNDTIRTPGSGDVIIDGGTGDDTVYADNTGDMAVWAFNVARNEPTEGNPDGIIESRYMLDNLQSDVNNSYNLFETDVVVNFKGFEVSAAISSNRGVVTDLDINQAIKKAINTDPVLSKLLVATDGPANTLVVSSLIDGYMDLYEGPVWVEGEDGFEQIFVSEVGDDALTISLEGPTAGELSPGDVSLLKSYYGASTSGFVAADFVSYFADEIGAFEDQGDYVAHFARDNSWPEGTELTGSDSEHTSDNEITGGLGNDVLVLGTGEDSNDTVVYEGFGNGTDTIVYFDTGNSLFTVIEEIDSGRRESFTVTFDDITASAGETVTFDGVVVALNDVAAGLVPAEDVALAFAEQYDGMGNWDVTYTPGSASITLTNNNPAVTPDPFDAEGDVDPNIESADFDFSSAANDESVVISNYVEGLEAESFNAEATPTTFVLNFDPNGLGTDVIADDTGTITYLGEVIDFTDGDGAITLADAFASEVYDDWTAELNDDGTSVTFTARTLGDAVLVPAAPVPVDGVDPVITSSTLGTDEVTGGGTFTEILTFENGDDGIDYLDFSSYDAVAVYVDGALVAGSNPTAVGQSYITLVETAEAGVYTISEKLEVGALGTASDTTVGLIGTADFGMTMDFVEENFIL
ncbi:MAG: hypothetical protein V4684_06440 [Pseudomonadota bacterium]